MAIAFRSIGTRSKVDTSVTPGAVSVSLPAGHTTNDLLLMFVTTDDNTNTTADPSGWTRLFYITNGLSVQTPYTPRLRTKCYYRIDNGSLGASVSLSFDTSSSWPTGKPSVIAFVMAYTGCDLTGPIERWDFLSTTATTAAQAHPQETTSVTGDWLLTFRGVSSDSPGATFTCSVGTDVERQDDIDLINELACATYDSNASLTAGLQTQRTTTASRAATYGSLMASVVLKVASTASAAVAVAGTAAITFTAPSATTVHADGPWDLCAAGGLPIYSYAIDWASDGSFTTLGDEATGDVVSDVAFTYGRDQNRQLNPAAVGNGSFSLCNVSRNYSPENPIGTLFGDLEPARPMRAQITWQGNTYPLFRGRIDDFNIKADMTDRTVDFTFLDGLSDLSENKLSTAVYRSMRTGELINTILDLSGWTGGRDIDNGATIVAYWWVEGVDAFAAINDLVKSEGPPSVAFVAPDGTFVFHDRHHRLQNSTSSQPQGVFAAPRLFDCAAPAVTGLSFSPPFTYAHGWRDIVNSVSFDVSERSPDPTYTPVWTSDDIISLSIGQGVDIDTSGSDPFIDAQLPVAGTDYTVTGAGTLNVTLSRTSGQTARITLLAIGGSVLVSGLQLRARAIPVRRTSKVTRTDSGSITVHGERDYPETAPWANANDAEAIANMILLHYSQRRPTVELTIVTSDPTHFTQAVQRTVSDRITIINDELGLDADFFIERVTHQIQRVNRPGTPPIHTVKFGCEKELVQTANPFRFDVRGAGFDQGVFDPISADDAGTVFTFDHPTQGQFDLGLFGT